MSSMCCEPGTDDDETALPKASVRREKLSAQQLAARLLAVLLAFGGSAVTLVIFFKAFLRKIPPPIPMFPQLYFALGYFLLALGLYLLLVTLRTLTHG